MIGLHDLAVRSLPAVIAVLIANPDGALVSKYCADVAVSLTWRVEPSSLCTDWEPSGEEAHTRTRNKPARLKEARRIWANMAVKTVRLCSHCSRDSIRDPLSNFHRATCEVRRPATEANASGNKVAAYIKRVLI